MQYRGSIEPSLAVFGRGCHGISKTQTRGATVRECAPAATLRAIFPGNAAVFGECWRGEWQRSGRSRPGRELGRLAPHSSPDMCYTERTEMLLIAQMGLP